MDKKILRQGYWENTIGSQNNKRPYRNIFNEIIFKKIIIKERILETPKQAL